MKEERSAEDKMNVKNDPGLPKVQIKSAEFRNVAGRIPDATHESRTDERDLSSPLSAMSETTDESFTLYGLISSTKPRRRGKLPAPLKFPKWFTPKLLTPQEEQVLVNRLCKAPERWDEKYGEDIKRKREFRGRKASSAEINNIVQRLSRSNNDVIAGTEKEAHEVSRVQPELTKDELETMVERLSRLKTKDDEILQAQPRDKKILTASDVQQLTERLNRPKVVRESNVPPKLTRSQTRFVGYRPLDSADVEKMVERISYKGMKSLSRDDERRKAEGRKWSSWTPENTDYNLWRKMSSRTEQYQL